jgi:hypothetical protein
VTGSLFQTDDGPINQIAYRRYMDADAQEWSLLLRTTDAFDLPVRVRRAWVRAVRERVAAQIDAIAKEREKVVA